MDHGEEVVVVRTEHSVEVHCHGGLAASRAIVDDLVAGGCEPVDQVDWLKETAGDAIEAAAGQALCEARTERAALVLLDQLNGALRGAIEQVVAAISAAEMLETVRQLDELLARGELGRRLTKPARVVLTGAPNVGKSSLINALVGFERAIVFDTPGTTRDVVTATTAIDGWAVELVDTAGLRQATSDIEHQGIELARTVLAAADVVLRLSEATQWLAEAPPEGEFDRWIEGKQVIEVANKVDQLSEPQRQALKVRQSPLLVLTSAATREGIDELLRVLANRLVPEPVTVGAAVPFTSSQLDALVVARGELSVGDLRSAKDSLLAML
jgi:tRNA modification GTPase